MRWTLITIGASLALSGTAYGSYASGMAVGGAADGLFQRQAGSGRCGSDNGNTKCPAGQCCSQWGYCGVGNEFCNPIALCQSDYGSCLGMSQSATPPPAPTSTSAAPPAPPVTTTTQAPPPPPPTTTSAAPPSTTAPVRPPPVTTTTTPPASTSQAPPPPPPIQPGPGGTLIPSPNGMCGNATTCAGSGRGSCCSQFFYCGDGIDYCGTGCQSKFGLCFGGVAAAPPPPAPVQSQSTTTPAAPAPSASPSQTSSAAAPPSPSASASPVTLPPGVSVTTDGSCGNGKTCLGSTFGACCSQFGFCGTGDQFCPAIVACQPEWGRCDS